MELPIRQCRSSLQGCVDPPLTVGTARRVPRVDITDDRQTAAAGQHWTGVEPLKDRLISLLSDITCYVEEHCSPGGSIIIRLDNGASVGLIYSLLVFS